MPRVIFDPNDVTLLSERTDMEKISFLKRHLDAFLTFYQEQGKTYWLQYFITFREHVYKKEFKTIYASLEMCKHQVTFICDEAFIVLHKEFIECSKTKKVKSLIWDMVIVVLYYIHFQQSYPTTLNNDPFRRSETKNAFTRLFGSSEKFNHPVFKRLMDILVAPIFMLLTGNFYNMLQRWIKEKKTGGKGTANITNWVYPSEWSSPDFIPNRFEGYITCFYGSNLERELGLTENPLKQIIIFEGRPTEPKTPFLDKKYQVLNCTCDNKKPEYEAFKKLLLNDDNVDRQFRFKCNHTDEDINNIVYLDDCDTEIEIIADNLIDTDCPACYEEAKKTVLFKLAETKFSLEQEGEDKTKTNPSNKSKKKKKKKSKRNTPTLTSNEDDKFLQDILNEECHSGDDEGAVGFTLEKSVVTDQVVKRCLKVGYAGNINVISGNIKRIETHVKMHGKIDHEHINLMFKTGDLLKTPLKTKKEDALKTPLKTKKEDAMKTPLKTKTEETLKTPSKTKLVPSTPDKSPEDEFKKNNLCRFCSNCKKMKEAGVKLKKCGLCVKENIVSIRYYCNRDCQAEDWSRCHKEEHEKGTLPKN